MRFLAGLLFLPLFLTAGTLEMVPNSFVYMDSFSGTPVDYNRAPHKWLKLKYLLKQVDWTAKCVWENTMGDPDVILINNYFGFVDNIGKRYPNKKKILIVWEPPTVDPKLHTPAYYNQFDKVLTWDDSMVDGKKFVKMHYSNFEFPRDNVPAFEDRHLVCMFIANKQSKHPKELYSYRRRIVDHYERTNDDSFHLYGPGWEKENLKNYKGAVSDKPKVQSNYKFSYCFENYDNNVGYITEKIFDCFKTLTIPIYMGASNICDYIPGGCFIDARKFNTIEEIDAFIKNISEAEYQKYVDNILAFSRSGAKNRFTEETFMITLMRAILAD